MGHGYVFSMAVGTIGEWLKVVPFLLGDEQLILRGGAGSFFFSSGRSERCLPVLTHKKGKDHFQCPFHFCAIFNNFALE